SVFCWIFGHLFTKVFGGRFNLIIHKELLQLLFLISYEEDFKLWIYKGLVDPEIEQEIGFMLLDMKEEEMVAFNEAPTDFYILVTGTSCAQEWSRTCCRRANVGDGTIIMNNLLQRTCWIMVNWTFRYLCVLQPLEEMIVASITEGDDPRFQMNLNSSG
ncbi:hypothetical protein MKW98_003409, partial [Papaver atlanticum]